jgi:hypothetical protein
LCEKAIVFNQQLGGGSPDCKASNFKCRLWELEICGEKLLANREEAAIFIVKFTSFIDA